LVTRHPGIPGRDPRELKVQPHPKAGEIMKTLVWVIAAAAVILFVIGLTVPALGFLIGAAPVLLAVALVLLLLRGTRGRRIPR
jgi:Flp pilus assembly protein TadB